MLRTHLPQLCDFDQSAAFVETNLQDIAQNISKLPRHLNPLPDTGD